MHSQREADRSKMNRFPSLAGRLYVGGSSCSSFDIIFEDHSRIGLFAVMLYSLCDEMSTFYYIAENG